MYVNVFPFTSVDPLPLRTACGTDRHGLIGTGVRHRRYIAGGDRHVSTGGCPAIADRQGDQVRPRDVGNEGRHHRGAFEITALLPAGSDVNTQL